jgi:hypothetical protein
MALFCSKEMDQAPTFVAPLDADSADAKIVKRI